MKLSKVVSATVLSILLLFVTGARSEEYQTREKIVVPLIDVEDEKLRSYLVSYLNIIFTYTNSFIATDQKPNFLIIDNSSIRRKGVLDASLLQENYKLANSFVDKLMRLDGKSGKCGLNYIVEERNKIIFTITILRNELSFQKKVRCLNLSVGENLGFKQNPQTKEDLLVLPANVMALAAIKVCENEEEMEACVNGVLRAYVSEIKKIFMIEENN